MSIVQGLNRQQYQLDTQSFSKGGEGEIYNISNQPNRVAKIYYPDRISQELESKLKIMVSRPPNQAVLAQVAWPLDVVYDTSGQFRGFIMPKLDITAALRELYEYPPQKYINVSISQKICIAQNICAVISEVHKAGYIFGDFNPLNIGVNLATGKVAFLDTDSYHIYDQITGNTYRCKVCLDGYVAPELLKACENYTKDAYANAPLPTFTQETDNFALAIHIFKLLMNGYTPYNGIPETTRGSTASPGVGNDAVKRDHYCFKPGNKPQAVAVPPLDILPEEIAGLFTRSFMLGKLDPKQRPNAVVWHAALGRYEQSLQTCHRNPAHQYRNGRSTCPWCEADQRYANAIGPTIPQKTFPTPVTSPSNMRTQPGAQRQSTNTYVAPQRAKNRSATTLIAIVSIILITIVLIGLASANRFNSQNNPVIVNRNGSNPVQDPNSPIKCVYQGDGFYQDGNVSLSCIANHPDNSWCQAPDPSFILQLRVYNVGNSNLAINVDKSMFSVVDEGGQSYELLRAGINPEYNQPWSTYNDLKPSDSAEMYLCYAGSSDINKKSNLYLTVNGFEGIGRIVFEIDEVYVGER